MVAAMPQFLHDCSKPCNASTRVPHSVEPGITLCGHQSRSFGLVSPDRLIDLEKKPADSIHHTSLFRGAQKAWRGARLLLVC